MTQSLRHSLLPLFILLFSFVGTARAAALPVPAAPAISAKAWMLMDFHSGRVLASENVDERMEPASLTKMMTAYVVYAELHRGSFTRATETVVSEKAWRMEGSKMFIEVGKRVTVDDLLKGLIIQSGNDASVALAELTAGSEDSFADYMNSYAERLGMTGTHFVNATGLPHPEHYTTAHDMARLGAALIRDFPEEYKLYAQKSFEYNGIEQNNRNRLLWRDKSVDGIKTGHTEAAGYCLVASAMQDDMRLVSVVMGTSSDKARSAETQKLLNYGFRFFESYKLYSAGEALEQARIWKGSQKELPLGVQSDVYVTIPRGRRDSLQAQVELQPQITAPAQQGQAYGELKISAEGEPLLAAPLVALQAVPEGGFIQRAMDSVLLYFE
jgi:D-alanyl-D-alanine carboxypeptidase (penicillin-binding protein 5/6)